MCVATPPTPLEARQLPPPATTECPPTESATFFTSSCGFTEAPKTALPPERLKLYEDSGRNPKVLVREL